MQPHIHLIVPKLPSRNLATTKEYYQRILDFECIGEYPDYLLMRRGEVELHFFLYKDLNPATNYGMCYLRVTGVDALIEQAIERGALRPSLGQIETKPWGMREFAILDTDTNLLTFGEAV